MSVFVNPAADAARVSPVSDAVPVAFLEACGSS